MIAYRFQSLKDHPRHGVLSQDNKPVSLAVFFTPKEAKDTAVPFESTRLTMLKIQHVVADYCGVSPDHMRSKSRDRGHVYPRQMAMLIVRELLPMHGLTEIGRRFGGRDHTTVMHSLTSVKDRIATDEKTKADYNTLKAKLSA